VLSITSYPKKPVAQEKKPSTEPPKPISLDKPAGGALKFGDGEILTLLELVKRASDAFHVPYSADARIGDNRYFLSGSYNKEDFEKAMAAVTTVPPVGIKDIRPDRTGDLALLRSRLLGLDPAALDVTALRDSLRIGSSDQKAQLDQKFGATEELSAADFLNGKSVSAAQLCQGKPGLSFFLQQQGIAPGAMLTLYSDLALDFEAPGMHIVSHGYNLVDGEKRPMWSPNQSAVTLK